MLRGSEDQFLSMARSEEEKRMWLILFIDYLIDQRISPNNILPGLRFLFVANNADISFFSSPQIALARRVTYLSPREVVAARQARYRCPATWEMVSWIRCNRTRDVTELLVYMAVAIGFNFAWRVGQMAWDGESRGKHAIRNEDVILVFGEGEN